MIATYRLPARFDLYGVASVRRDLADALRTAAALPDTAQSDTGEWQCLDIDGSAVQRIDGAALAMLVLLAAEARRRGRLLRVSRASALLARALEHAGVAEALGLASNEPA